MAWHGMAWHGMTWHGMTWHGMGWNGRLTWINRNPLQLMSAFLDSNEYNFAFTFFFSFSTSLSSFWVLVWLCETMVSSSNFSAAKLSFAKTTMTCSSFIWSIPMTMDKSFSSNSIDFDDDFLSWLSRLPSQRINASFSSLTFLVLTRSFHIPAKQPSSTSHFPFVPSWAHLPQYKIQKKTNSNSFIDSEFPH
jgi:hypothetical protein